MRQSDDEHEKAPILIAVAFWLLSLIVGLVKW
jgi:hypothetical protein